MSKQIAVWKMAGDLPSTSTTEFCHAMASANSFSTEPLQSMVVSAAGVMRNLRVVVSAAPGVGKSWVVTLRVNGGNTALTVTISGASTDVSDTTHDVNVAVDDLISLSFAPSGTPTSMIPSVSLEFDSTTPGASIYGGSSGNALTLTRFTALLGGNSTGNWGGEVSINAVEGDFTRLDVSLDGAPGTGSYTFTIEKNGVLQNGSGGTVDTRVTISNAATTGSATFTLSCSPGDEFRLQGAPSSPGTARRPRFGVALVADTPGHCNYVSTNISNNLDNAATRYHSFGAADMPWTTTESDHQATVSVGFDLLFIAVSLNLSPGAGKSYAFDVRKNGANAGLTATVSDTNTSGTGTGTVSFAADDTIDMRCVPTGTPTARSARFACSMFIPEPATGRSYGYIF